jgi:hypothetical protein
MTLAGSGWYPDPSGRRRSRLWDGHRWTAWTDEFHAQDPLAEDESFSPPDPEGQLLAPGPESAPDAQHDVRRRENEERWRRQRAQEDRRRTMTTGCLLAAIWIIGLSIIAFNAMLNGFSGSGSGSEAGDQRTETVGWIGFAILIAITAFIVLARRRRGPAPALGDRASGGYALRPVAESLASALRDKYGPVADDVLAQWRVFRVDRSLRVDQPADVLDEACRLRAGGRSPEDAVRMALQAFS